jgi:hypothetical protein
MAELLKLLIAPMKHFMQIFHASPLIPIRSNTGEYVIYQKKQYISGSMQTLPVSTGTRYMPRQDKKKSSSKIST